MSHLMRARRPSRTQALPVRAVLTLSHALLLLVSPVAMVSLPPARLPALLRRSKRTLTEQKSRRRVQKIVRIANLCRSDWNAICY